MVRTDEMTTQDTAARLMGKCHAPSWKGPGRKFLRLRTRTKMGMPSAKPSYKHSGTVKQKCPRMVLAIEQDRHPNNRIPQSTIIAARRISAKVLMTPCDTSTSGGFIHCT